MSLSAFEVAITASLLMGVVMVLFSLFLLYKGKLKLDAAGDDTSLEVSKYLKLSTHYPALTLFLIGGAFIGYPLYLSSGTAVQPKEVRVRVVIEPSSDMSDVKVRITALGNSSEELPDSYGDISWVFSPVLRQVRIEITAPGRKSVSKLVTLQDGGSVMDAGDIVVPAPVVPVSVLATISVDTASVLPVRVP